MQTLATGSPLTLRNGTVDVGDHYISSHHIALKLGNDGARHDVVAILGSGSK